METFIEPFLWQDYVLNCCFDRLPIPDENGLFMFDWKFGCCIDFGYQI